MPNLIAQGVDASKSWKRAIPESPVTLGRLAELSDWAVGWDLKVSRRHALMHWRDGRLYVRRDRDGRNPIYFRGTDTEFREFAVAPGEHFVIGDTTFYVEGDESDGHPDEGPVPDAEYTCSAQELRSMAFTDGNVRIEALAALPAVIRFAPSEALLESRVGGVLLRGIARAVTASVLRLVQPPTGQQPMVEVRSVESREGGAGDFRPSRRLVAEAVQHRRQSVLHLWESADSKLDYTIRSSDSDWAMCTPLPDDPTPGWALYLTGKLPEGISAGPMRDSILKGDLKFAELAADLFAALRQLCDLQRRQGQLSRFLSPTVVAALAGKDMDEVFRPRQVRVTVLFADLRGSCRIAEEGQHDMMALWAKVTAALSIMTSSVLDVEGVVNDFQGDAVMGFWGWPTEQPDQIERAARAALAIRRRFQTAAADPNSPLFGMSSGIGIAHGEAVAGRLGTLEQFKIDVFGPTVNLAARLESLTKHFGVPILMDDECGKRLAEVDPTGQWVRSRKLARVKPYGMRRVLTATELLPPAAGPGVLAEEDRRDYEAALAEFQAGRWDDARSQLERLPPDGAARYLAEFMDEHPAGPPPRWDGVIDMKEK
jgi:adenylate cyclase